MDGFEEAAHYGGIAGVFATVLAELARVAVEGLRFGNLHSQELYHDIPRFYAWEIVCKVGTYSKRGDTFSPGVFIDPDSLVCVKTITENHLFGGWINVE